MARRQTVSDTGTLLDDYLTDDELARELEITVRTLRTWRTLGDAPPLTKIGPRNYTYRADARDWLRKRAREVAV